MFSKDVKIEQANNSTIRIVENFFLSHYLVALFYDKLNSSINNIQARNNEPVLAKKAL